MTIRDFVHMHYYSLSEVAAIMRISRIAARYKIVGRPDKRLAPTIAGGELFNRRWYVPRSAVRAHLLARAVKRAKKNKQSNG